jgi:tetratricopeptide (TPR) repeat protein
VVSRPNYGGNNYFGGANRPGVGNEWNSGGGWGLGGNQRTDIISNNTNINNINNNNIFNNRMGWGGGGWGGGYGGWGRGYGGWRGGYGGWAAPYYGNWYRGGNAFWTGFGVGALSSFGIGGLYGYPAYGYGGLYSYFPTWGMTSYAGWGLGPVATNWLYSGYTNPYYASFVAAQPVATTSIVYDYSQPINVTVTPSDESAATSTEQVFSAARDAFLAGDYQRAIDLADQVLKQTPNVPVVHELRALALFALGRYDEAAAVEYAVLSAGPGWNWSTLVGLYPSVDTYTKQLRALEEYSNSHPNSASAHFLLAVHYLVQEHTDAAAAQFERVVQLQPNDQLSASFVKALRKGSEIAANPPPVAVAQASNASGSQAEAAPPTPEQDQQPPAPPPPPAALAGTWKAQPADDVAISLTLNESGDFTWEVDTKGQKQKLEGKAGFQDGTLALIQAEGPPLVGKVTQDGSNKFVFAPPSAPDKEAGLTFTR